MTAKHPADRQAKLRSIRKKAGLTLIRVWVPLTLVGAVRDAIQAVVDKETKK